VVPRRPDLLDWHEYMKVVIHTDASFEIGTGHVMRCLTLAEQLRDEGASIVFICRWLPKNLCDRIEERGYSVHRLLHDQQRSADEALLTGYERWLGVPPDEDAAQTINLLNKKCLQPDWLVVDHYALDARWEEQMRPYTNKIMVIDDLANRPHDADLLLDQNFYENAQYRYEGLVPSQCRTLLGPRYALLRREFRQAREKMSERDGIVRRLLVFFGGADRTNETAKSLEAIRSVGRNDLTVDVVIGMANPHQAQIEAVSRDMPFVTLHYCAENMADLMLQADLAIGAGGTTTWERCSLGLPTITVIVAENQRETIEAVATRGAVWNMGWYSEVSVTDLEVEMRFVFSHPEEIQAMSQNALLLMGGLDRNRGNAVVAAMMEAAHAVC
jgi:UDP-2,4-diacetamido-2,4,6-trideoxy-beta-L-altropyranose hydrolase